MEAELLEVRVQDGAELPKAEGLQLQGQIQHMLQAWMAAGKAGVIR